MPPNLLTIDRRSRHSGLAFDALAAAPARRDPSVRRGGRRLVRLTATRNGRWGKVKGEIPPFTESHPTFRPDRCGPQRGPTTGRARKHAILERMNIRRGVLWDSSAILALLDETTPITNVRL